MKIQAFSTLGEISHFAISGYFVISGFDITGVYCSVIGKSTDIVYILVRNQYKICFSMRSLISAANSRKKGNLIAINILTLTNDTQMIEEKSKWNI